MDLQDIFPEAIVNDETSMGENWVSLEQDGRFVHFPITSLSRRELALLGFKKDDKETPNQPQNAWYHYLVQKKGQPPQQMDAVQLIYIEHQHRLSPDLIEFYTDLLPNLSAVLSHSATRTVLLLNQEQPIEAAELIQDILPTIENDFGVKLTTFFGNVWTKLQNDELRDYFDSENKLFTDFNRYKGNENSISFAQMILWAASRRVDMGVIPAKILSFINDSKDMRDVIETMWVTHGNLVQTAQQLFMHRNSLQYKLDKFYSLSGLNLKNLDDLAFCHLLILND